MDLRTDYPYWLMKNGIKHAYPSLNADIDVHVAIIGAGISGALAAYYLYRDDLKVAVLDRHHAGMGATAASTALLQYELDVPLHILAGQIGRVPAVHAYKLCRKAIYDLQQICKKLRTDVAFGMRPSLQYASEARHRHMLYREYGFRLKNGFRVNWLESDETERLFGIKTPGAILSEDGGVVDAYLLTHSLLEYVQQKEYRIYDNTEATSIQYEQNHVLITTGTGHKVRAKKVVIACGHESLSYLPRQVAETYSTYAVATEPLPPGSAWYHNSLIWETAKPYTYLRFTDDNRIIIGGKDDLFHNAAIRDARVKKKTEKLLQSFSQRFPHLPVRADFSWAGTYLATADGLPYIGSVPELPNTFFALGFGGNGVTFSVLAAQMIRDMIKGKQPKDSEIFSFNR